MRTNAKAEPTLPELLANLSEPGPGASSLRAAAALLESRAPEEAIAGLLPLLVRHKTLPLALGHLERAGGDLGALTIPASLYESTYPLNRLLPPWPGDGDDRISLFELRRRLHAHGAVQDGDVRRLGEEAGEDRFMLVTGQAWAVAYPEYPRWCADADLFAPDLETGLHLLDCLCSRMGFVMHGFKVGRLDVDGFAILKTFRMAGGNEINIGLMAGGYASPFLAVPLRTAPPMDSARMVVVDGRKALVCSPEDLLLMTVLRPVREAMFNHRGVNDVRFLLTREADALDWDRVTSVARANRLLGSLARMTREAESREGRTLVPPEVAATWRPERWEQRLLGTLYASSPGMRDGPVSASPQDRKRAAKTFRWLWQFAFLRGAVGSPRAVRHYVLERAQSRVFRRQVRLVRASGGRPRRYVRLAGALRPGYRSLCELREGEAPDEVGVCLSRGRREGARPRWFGPPQQDILGALERRMPDRGEERGFRKRRTKDPASDQAHAHRCEGFVVELMRSPRTRTPGGPWGG